MMNSDDQAALQLIQDFLVGHHVYNVYAYGSRVYGTCRADSDYDFIVVADVLEKMDGITLANGVVNLTIYSPEEFQEQVHAHEISVLECIFLAPTLVLKEEMLFPIELDLKKLRESISAKCSNSWVKAKKKLTIPEDFDELIAKKSLWHVFRIYNFGSQLAVTGRIYDYSASNALFNSIMDEPGDWEYLQAKYQPFRNKVASAFKLVAPK